LPALICSHFLQTHPTLAALLARRLLHLRLLRQSHDRWLIVQYFSKPGRDSGLFFCRYRHLYEHQEDASALRAHKALSFA
jgi:hypothetical protein